MLALALLKTYFTGGSFESLETLLIGATRSHSFDFLVSHSRQKGEFNEELLHEGQFRGETALGGGYTVGFEELAQHAAHLLKDHLLQHGVSQEEVFLVEVLVKGRLQQLHVGLMNDRDEVPNVGPHRLAPRLLLAVEPRTLCGLKDNVHRLRGAKGFKDIAKNWLVLVLVAYPPLNSMICLRLVCVFLCQGETGRARLLASYRIKCCDVVGEQVQGL